MHKTSTEIGQGIQRKKCPVLARKVGKAAKAKELDLTAFTTCMEIQNSEKVEKQKITQLKVLMA